MTTSTMIRMRRGAALLVVAIALLAAGAANAAVQLADPTPVRVWAGTALLSIRESAGFRLATQRGAAPPMPLPGIAPAQRPFEASIGPGPSGSPVIVFARCRHGAECRLMRTTLAGGQETAITGSAGANGFEHAPAVWGNTLAFARRMANGSEDVYVRPLGTSKPTRSTRLPGIPRPACEELRRPRCPPTAFRPTILALSLRGSLLVETVDLGVIEEELCDRTEVRLLDLANRHSQRITWSECGLSGSHDLGGSLTATQVLWARTCPGDPSGCGGHYAILYRYGLHSHRVQSAPQADVIVGFAAEDGEHAVEITAPEVEGRGDCINAEEPPPCQLARVGPIAFKSPGAHTKRARRDSNSRPSGP